MKNKGEPKIRACTMCKGSGEILNINTNQFIECPRCDGIGKWEDAHWECDSCGYKDYEARMPYNRQEFYDKVHVKGAPKCPKCKSESFMPVGF